MPRVTILITLFVLNACIVGTNDKKDQANLLRAGVDQIDDVFEGGTKNFTRRKTITTNEKQTVSRVKSPIVLPENFDPEDPSTWPEGINEKNLKDHI